MEYPGFRVFLNIKLIDGKLTDNLQIDVGVGDKVEAESLNIDLLAYKNSPLFEESISLLVYPAESIFAEKLETVASKGSISIVRLAIAHQPKCRFKSAKCPISPSKSEQI